MIIQLILIQVVTFGVILFVLRLLFGSQLKIALTRLQALHQESLEKEEILNKELDRAKSQCEAEIARSKEEAGRIVENARHSAEKIALEAAEKAQGEARKIIAEAAERTKRLQDEMSAGAEEKAVEIASDLIKFTFTQKGCEALHAQLIDELIEELKSVDKNRLAVKVDQAQVMTSLALDPEEKKRLREVLLSKLGYELTLEEKIDPSLVIGMVIKLGGLVIDGSIRNKLMRAMNTLHLSRS